MSISLRTRFARGILLALALLAGAAWAQAPSATLSASRSTVGAPVTLRARGLTPGAEYRLELRRPGGSTETETLASSSAGSLSTTFRPDREGMWIVRIRGGDVYSIFGLAVTAEDDAERGPAAEGASDAGASDARTTDSDTSDTGTSEERAGASGSASESLEEDSEGTMPDVFRIDGADVIALRGDEPVWRLAFPESSGPTGPLHSGSDALWVPHGISLLEVDPAAGTVVRRHVLPAPVSSLTSEGGDVVATVAFADGTTTEVRVADAETHGEVRFGTDPEIFHWLRREAEVDDPLARLATDPTNPWLYLRAGLAATRESATRAAATREGATPEGAGDPGSGLLAEAVERGDTFFDLAGIAAELHAAGEEALAGRALDAAFRDFADRGYDPRLLSEPELREAYGFPLEHLRRAVAEGEPSAASFWAPWAYRTAGGDAGPTRDALRAYASLLREAGDREGASLWSARAGELRRVRMGAAMDRVVLGLAGAGWLAALALLGAAALLYATLAAKYWRPQSLHLRHRREAGRTRGSWARAVAIRFFSTTEKAVLVLLMASALAVAGLAAWGDHADLPAAAGSGTLASAPARAWVDGLDGDATRAAFVSGYAAHVSGDADAARVAYEAAGSFAPAVNNLGAVQDEERMFQRALELAPGFPEARYNLGRITSPSPFHDAYRPGQPLLAVPSHADLAIAAGGPWLQAVGDAFARPWGTLRATAPGMPLWLWTAVLVFFFVLALALVVALFVPRPHVARNAPRTLLYHLLALLIPGAGLADELWGLLLLAPWSILGLDALVQATGAGSVLGFSLSTTLWSLGVLYAINVAAFVVETLSYRKRMRDLERDQPERARSFGLRA